MLFNSLRQWAGFDALRSQTHIKVCLVASFIFPASAHAMTLRLACAVWRSEYRIATLSHKVVARYMCGAFMFFNKKCRPPIKQRAAFLLNYLQSVPLANLYLSITI